MVETSKKVVEDHWSRYWETGQLHACTAEFPDEVRSGIADKWVSLFSGLADGARVLDVATGNGALIALAQENVEAGKTISLVGVDLAQIDPVTNVGFTCCDDVRVEFQGGIDAADLPYEDREFSVVVSQFGIEYSEFERAISEACRVADHKVVCLIHATDGAVVRQNGMIPGQIDWLRSELGLFEAAREHLTRETGQTRRRLSDISAAIREKCGSLENPDFLYSSSQYMGRLLAQSAAMAAGQALEYIEAMEAQMEANARRMQALVDASCSEADLIRVSDICKTLGYNPVRVTNERSSVDQHPVGYWLEAERPGSKQGRSVSK